MTHLPHLSKTQATGLALWRLGMVLARSCALTAVSTFLAEGLQQKANTVRQGLREWWFRRIVRLGWHPFLRINNGGTFRPEGSPLYHPLLNLVPEVGTQWGSH